MVYQVKWRHRLSYYAYGSYQWWVEDYLEHLTERSRFSIARVTHRLLRDESSTWLHLHLRYHQPTSETWSEGSEDQVSKINLFWLRHHHMAVHEYPWDSLMHAWKDGGACACWVSATHGILVRQNKHPLWYLEQNGYEDLPSQTWCDLWGKWGHPSITSTAWSEREHHLEWFLTCPYGAIEHRQ